MIVYIRVDTSNEIGTGHVMRCLTLAKRLRTYKAAVTFICRELTGHLCAWIEGNGFNVVKLPSPSTHVHLPLFTKHSHWLGVPLMVDAAQTKAILAEEEETVDLLIIDHYAINREWEGHLRKVVKKIMVIDDLADRMHDCDFLMDQNIFVDYQNRYFSLVPPHCKTFLGPSYVLLRTEFYEQRKKLKRRIGPVKRILIFFGGIDSTNETGKALAAFLRLGRSDIHVDVVVGQSNCQKQVLASICEQYENLHFHCQVNTMAELLGHADLSIGAGGTTTWERCYLGVPSIVWSVAENQEEICETLARNKIINYLGKKEQIEQTFLSRQLQILIDNEAECSEMSRLSSLLMKDNFVNQRTMVAEIMR
ncbi:UDP-2,4-diacetamido-2,4,6-trideoxy-beta-L-altropyranose hydrolase [Peribacillus sp. NPDC056705]|uniref:UDP-2,4-diacetamido-2,4, 6-trideoxy-beta-L-altropyranose hydrolase n=1 Tax=Peribacillus sp. NPDC056705 TaxID=3345918 RepID=UPI0037479E39